MGRLEKSQGLAPPAVRKDDRAKQARHIINKVVPALLASSSRARKGSESGELVVESGSSRTAFGTLEANSSEDAQYTKRKGQGKRKVKVHTAFAAGIDSVNANMVESRKKRESMDHALVPFPSQSSAPNPPRKPRSIRIVATDTLTAAHMLAFPWTYGDINAKISKKAANVCILNMASPLRPGGGVLTGATSQEEYLCSRTTLLPSLKENFYRLPEYGGIWTSDVLVFRNSLPLGNANGELGPSDRYWVDCVSAGMLRFPELEGKEDEVQRLSKNDRIIVERKMCAVLRMAAQKGVKKFVLGAWGCGAYGNPVEDIAQAWKKVLKGMPTSNSHESESTSEPEPWPDLEDIVFAISNRKMAAHFAQAFDSGIEVEPGPNDTTNDEDQGDDDQVAQELRTKILEIESQLSSVWNPDLKCRMAMILAGLKAQVQEREDQAGRNETSDEGVSLIPEEEAADAKNEDECDGDYRQKGIVF
ncbi:hypothetical protein GQ44DRAFT_706571 [Phaeosphaeriaceae sp. PMI808]|nr:hypothetical protein GQ44DRAFT_706571 [Phaeosphaeriaceae sp. PMI808]